MSTASLAARGASTSPASRCSRSQAGGGVGVAVFGTLVAGDAAQIVAGLHRAALVSCGLLVAAGLLAHRRIGSRPAPVAHPA